MAARSQTGAQTYQNPYDDQEMLRLLSENPTLPGTGPSNGALGTTPLPWTGGTNPTGDTTKDERDAKKKGVSDGALPTPTATVTPAAYQADTQAQTRTPSGLPQSAVTTNEDYAGASNDAAYDAYSNNALYTDAGAAQAQATGGAPALTYNANTGTQAGSDVVGADLYATGQRRSSGDTGQTQDPNPPAEQLPVDTGSSGETVDKMPVPTDDDPLKGLPGWDPNKPATDTSASGDWASKDYRDPANIRAFFESRGIHDQAQLDRLVATWSAYRGQAWANDTAYFFKRMSDENDLTGSNSRQSSSSSSSDNDKYKTDPEVEKTIRRLLQRGFEVPTGDDPTIRAQFNPVSQVIQRNNARAKASQAERAFAQGQVGEGANDVSSNAIDQASSQDEASAMSSFIGDELAARRQDVYQAMQLAQGEEKNALAQLLGMYDVELRRLGLNNQNQQYYDDLGFRIGSKEADYNKNVSDYLARS